MKKYIYILTLLFIFINKVNLAQDFSEIGKRKPVKISGGINATGVGYTASGIQNRRDPFNWFLTGNINFDIYGWHVPFSFSLSDQNRQFQQPFNQYGIQPQYKWIKAYLGYNALNYSQYTLAGHVFLGAGVELTPKKWYFSAMYGRFNKAVEEDTLSENNIIPAYRRMGFAMKVGYGDTQNFIGLILFKAKDDTASLSKPILKNEIYPAENLAVSIQARKKLGQRIAVGAEWASSAFTRDIRAESLSAQQKGALQQVDFLFKPRTSSSYYQAFNTYASYFGNFYSLQLNYERVGPDYQTLGAYYFNNNIENITLNTTLALLAGKLNTSTNLGTQRNNLDNTELNNERRIIGSFSINYVPNAHWSFMTSYSNFTTFTNIRPQLDPFFKDDLDTLNFYQVSQNANINIGYSFGSKTHKQGIFGNGSYQVVREVQQNENTNGNETFFYSGNLAWRYTIVPMQVNLSTAVNFNRSLIGPNESIAFGPNISVSKAFLKKTLRSSLACSYNQVVDNKQTGSRVMYIRANGSYILKKQHNFSLNLNFLQRFKSTMNTNSFTEFTARVSYGYNF